MIRNWIVITVCLALSSWGMATETSPAVPEQTVQAAAEQEKATVTEEQTIPNETEQLPPVTPEKQPQTQPVTAPETQPQAQPEKQPAVAKIPAPQPESPSLLSTEREELELNQFMAQLDLPAEKGWWKSLGCSSCIAKLERCGNAYALSLKMRRRLVAEEKEKIDARWQKKQENWAREKDKLNEDWEEKQRGWEAEMGILHTQCRKEKLMLVQEKASLEMEKEMQEELHKGAMQRAKQQYKEEIEDCQQKFDACNNIQLSRMQDIKFVDMYTGFKESVCRKEMADLNSTIAGLTEELSESKKTIKELTADVKLSKMQLEKANQLLAETKRNSRKEGLLVGVVASLLGALIWVLIRRLKNKLLK